MIDLSNLSQYDPYCTECVKNYIKKHNLRKGDKFEIPCNGIPLNPVPQDILLSYSDPEIVEAFYDPIKWAGKYLDWHCVDPKGEIWKRKTEEGSLEGHFLPYQEQRGNAGLSPYHRPYQRLLISCTSKHKVFRIGRQCIAKNSLIQLVDGNIKKIQDISVGDRLFSMNKDKILEEDEVLDIWSNGYRDTYRITTNSGKTIECTSDHLFYSTRGYIDKDHNKTINKLDECWLSIDHGLKKSDKIACAFTEYTKSNQNYNIEDENIGSIRSKTIIDNDILWDTIRSIEYIGKQEVFDLEIKKNHNFVANNFIAHNCGKTIALTIKLLHKMFTNEHLPIAVITPYESQINLIFGILEKYIYNSPLLCNSVARNVKKPNYTIKLHNGSWAIGYPAGTKSNQQSATARGAGAGLLLFDECDFLSDGDIDATLSLTTNFPNAEIIMSSTPTGKRQRFYYTCQSKYYKEYHYPSQVNPLFTEETDKYFRSQLTDVGYDHEILGLFGEQETGVFQHAYVMNATDRYSYGDYPHKNSWIYSIGVDWNDVKVGTAIVVVGYNPGNQTFYVVDKHIIQKMGWTQTAAIQKIVDLNRIWRPEFVYVDAGFNSCQSELLHMFGMKSAATQNIDNRIDANLAKIVHEYQFGGTIEISDPFTKEKKKKAAKPFLIENLVRKFEKGIIKFPEKDQAMIDNLLGYIVKSISTSGNPIYETNNEQAGDHLLDALALAVVGYALEMSELANPTQVNTVAFVDNPLTTIPPDRLENKKKQDRQRRMPEKTDNIPIVWEGRNRDEPPPAPRKSRVRGRRPVRSKF